MAITNDTDGFRVEAAMQFGFAMTNDDGDEYACTEAQLIAFAKACQRSGLALASRDAKEAAKDYHASGIRGTGAALEVLAFNLDCKIHVLDLQLTPFLAAEEIRSMTAAGYVRGTTAEPGNRWVKPYEHQPGSPLFDGADAFEAYQSRADERSACTHCVGANGACENCMNTGFADATAEDLR